MLNARYVLRAFYSRVRNKTTKNTKIHQLCRKACFIFPKLNNCHKTTKPNFLFFLFFLNEEVGAHRGDNKTLQMLWLATNHGFPGLFLCLQLLSQNYWIQPQIRVRTHSWERKNTNKKLYMRCCDVKLCIIKIFLF